MVGVPCHRRAEVYGTKPLVFRHNKAVNRYRSVAMLRVVLQPCAVAPRSSRGEQITARQ